jgi:hypothetical protein
VLREEEVGGKFGAALVPTRFKNGDLARERFGARADAYAAHLMEGDPLADDLVRALSARPPRQGRKMLELFLERGIEAVPDAPPEMVRFSEHVHRAPIWVDRATIDRGGATYIRCGGILALVMACVSLPLAYASPAGNKPLILSGRLVELALRRLAETVHWLLATCQPNGLEPFSEGFKITIRVRLIHAQVRRLLSASGRWDRASWGVPLNQSDLADTSLLFSIAPLEALTRLGFDFSDEERESVMQLWRWSGYLMGIEPDLLCVTEFEARRALELSLMTREAPDEDSRRLTDALMNAVPGFFVGPESDRSKVAWMVDACYAISRVLIGDEISDGLHYPRNPWRFVLPVLRRMVAQTELLRRYTPRGRELVMDAATEILERLKATGFGGAAADFDLPPRLND